MQEVKVATRIDQIMQLLIQAIETNQWSHPAVHDYKKVKDELTVHVGIILRGNRIVMPTFLRSKTVQLAHACHQGSVKTKRLLRKSGSQELTIHNCLLCQAATSGTHAFSTRTAENDATTQSSLETSCKRLSRTIPNG